MVLVELRTPLTRDPWGMLPNGTSSIGGGYAFSSVEASMLTRMVSCKVGIGFLEERA